jgi:hypothetical protein
VSQDHKIKRLLDAGHTQAVVMQRLGLTRAQVRRVAEADRMRCPQCRTSRVDAHKMFLHLIECERKLCTCGAYTYPHRPMGGDCFQNPDAQVAHASRAGTPDHELADVAADVAFSMRGKTAVECPF